MGRYKRQNTRNWKTCLLILAVLLVLVIIMPTTVFAEEDSPQTSVTISAEVNMEGAGTVSGAGTYKIGDTVTITAKPASGYLFYRWNADDPNLQNAGAELKFTAQEPMVLVAEFVKVEISDISDKVFTGNPIKPDGTTFTVSVIDMGGQPVEGLDYELSYGNNLNVGTGTVILTFSGGTVSKTFNITPADISTATVSIADQVYDGVELKPVPTVTWNDVTLVPDVDFTVKYENNVHVGTASFTVTGEGNFKSDTSVSGTFEIAKRPLIITAASAERPYDGTALSPDSASGDNLGQGDKILSVSFQGSQTEVGSSKATVSDAEICNAAGEDVTSEYDISYAPGTLTVDPAKVTIKVADASKIEGEPDPAFTGTVEGLADSRDLGTISYLRSNRDEAPGTYQGVINVDYTPNRNYDVTVINGNFTINAKPRNDSSGSSPRLYDVPEGHSLYRSWTKGSNDELKIIIERLENPESCFSHFREVQIDKYHADLPAEAGSTIITISPEILEALSVGPHTITVIFDDDEVEINLTIKAEETPAQPDNSSTSDPEEDSTEPTEAEEVPSQSNVPNTVDMSHPGVWITLFVLSGMILSIVIKCQKRKVRN
ncbi:MAG: hypothetical protein J5589_04115 [Firmicutes bacterium]|nr:hypothetical protein [Bacillota bacterium]